ncbi:SIMPL domain-containing protein [Balneola sp. MJW-20]|uniref:SIMPL domain-containing protein n=1 Tax=Gracilimonas aurantiaca TaxID=3234185 RepID=UPI003466E40F
MDLSKTSRTLSLILLIVLTFSGCSTAQSLEMGADQDRSLHISLSADEVVKADRLIFRININSQADTPADAYSTHKERESFLAGLLQKYDIEEEDIDYQLMRMNRQFNSRNNTETINTSQSVSVTFSDTDLYEEIQLTLIENGFDNFNGSFAYSKVEEAKKAAMKRAISKALEQAKLITEAAGTQLGNISRIVYSDYNVMPVQNMRMESASISMDTSPGMLDFEKSIVVRASVSVTYLIQ